MLDCLWTLCTFSVVPDATKKGDPQAANAEASLPFEAALKKLESIVEAMESEDMPLEMLLQKYQEGTVLARNCQEKIATAELKVRELEKNTAGELKLKPLPELSAEDEEE